MYMYNVNPCYNVMMRGIQMYVCEQLIFVSQSCDLVCSVPAGTPSHPQQDNSAEKVYRRTLFKCKILIATFFDVLQHNKKLHNVYG